MGNKIIPTTLKGKCHSILRGIPKGASFAVSWDLEWSYSFGRLGESFQGKDIVDCVKSPWEINLFSLLYGLVQRFSCSRFLHGEGTKQICLCFCL